MSQTANRPGRPPNPLISSHPRLQAVHSAICGVVLASTLLCNTSLARAVAVGSPSAALDLFLVIVGLVLFRRTRQRANGSFVHQGRAGAVPPAADSIEPWCDACSAPCPLRAKVQPCLPPPPRPRSPPHRAALLDVPPLRPPLRPPLPVRRCSPPPTPQRGLTTAQLYRMLHRRDEPLVRRLRPPPPHRPSVAVAQVLFRQHGGAHGAGAAGAVAAIWGVQAGERGRPRPQPCPNHPSSACHRRQAVTASGPS